MEETSSVADQIRGLILEVLPPVSSPDEVTGDASLGEDGLGFDSVALVDLLFACEDHFDIEVPADLLLEDGSDGGLTVARLVALVTGQLGEAGMRS